MAILNEMAGSKCDIDLYNDKFNQIHRDEGNQTMLIKSGQNVTMK